jgi:hypothetical protein
MEKKRMSITLKNVEALVSSTSTKLYVATTTFVHKNAGLFLFIFGVALLAGGVAEVSLAQSAGPDPTGAAADADGRISNVANALLNGFIEGPFGALIMIVAGLVAIIAAAMGAYRAAMACLVVAVGAFVLRAFVNLFFQDAITLE